MGSRDDRTVVVVGAGLAGLAAAEVLASDRHVIVLDRLPAPGGVLGYDHDVVRAQLQRTVGVDNVDMRLGTTALRWEPPRLLVAGPHGIEWLMAETLVHAGGARPATQAELGLLGSRLAGVLPAPVAVHLLEAGVNLGRRVCLIGDGDWARRTAERLQHTACRVIGLRELEGPQPDFGDAWWQGWRPAEVMGVSRVDALIVARGDLRRRIPCDTVILAADARPLRNVDGAITEAGAHVTFAQLARDRLSVDEVISHAQEIAVRLREETRSATT